MRVLFLSIYDPYAIGSGPSNHLRCLSQTLNKLGCEVHTLVFHPEKNDCTMNGVHLHYLNSRFHISAGRGFVFPLLSLREVNKLCKEYRIDIVHGQSPSSFGYALLRRNELPYVVTVHSTSFCEIASYGKLPLTHLRLVHLRDAMFNQPLCSLVNLIEYKRAHKIIAVSKATAREIARYFHVSEDKIVVIQNGISFPDFSSPREESTDRLILFVGRLVWRKGVKYLLEAMPHVLAKYPDAKLLLVGNGGARKYLEGKVRKVNIEKSVRFLGAVSKSTLHSLYSRANLYVLPSLYEAFNMTILEAMAMERPVVATRVGGVPEIVIDGETGLLVEPGNSLQLAEAMISLFSDPSYADKLARRGKKKAQREFAWERIGRMTLELYENTLEERTSYN